VKVSVCSTCSTDGAFVDVVKAGLPDCTVEGVECMSGCTRPQTVAFRQGGKVAYLFGDITGHDMDDLRRFARLYQESKYGTFADARVLGDLRLKALARIPG
jgi:predicted metal-binding protein